MTKTAHTTEDDLSASPPCRPSVSRNDAITEMLTARVESTDPIFALIKEAWRLSREQARLHAICGDKPDSDPSWGPQYEAHAAMWDHVRGVLLETVPTTAEGCRELAGFTIDFSADQGVPIGHDSNDAVLGLIAQSPLVSPCATQPPDFGPVRGYLTPASQCPAYATGLQIGRLVAEHNRLDELHIDRVENPQAYSENEGAMRDMITSVDLLFEAATFQRATSLEGAFAQLAIIANNVADIGDNELGGKEKKDCVDKAFRALHSISRVLEETTGLTPSDIGLEYVMGAWSDTLGRAMQAPGGVSNAPVQPPVVSSSIAAQLVELNARATGWWGAYRAANDALNAAESDADKPGAAVRYGMADLALTHAIRVSRAELMRAQEMPATTVRELGLQARLIAAELGEWWDDEKLEHGEKACRALLTRLIGLAGLAPIERKDVSLAELREWVERPFAYRGCQTIAEMRAPPKLNHDMPADLRTEA